MANLLGHRFSVRSNAGKGSVFTIEITPLPSEMPPQPVPPPQAKEDGTAKSVLRTGVVLIVEDDPGVREHLALPHHRARSSGDGNA